AGVKRVIEAAPQFGLSGGVLSVPQALGEIIKESFRTTNTNDGSPFGYIVGGERGWNDPPTAEDDKRPTETIITGDNLRAKWDALIADATEIFALHYEYRPVEQNSNTFVATLLNDVGLPQPTGKIFNEDGIPIGEYATPGSQSQYRLHDPLVSIG